MMDLETLLSRLDHVRRSGRGWIARCPSHPDSHPSLKVDDAGVGRAPLVCCFAGCSYRSIMNALGFTTSDAAAGGDDRHVDVHALALRIGRSQRWSEQFSRDITKVSRQIRRCYWSADVLRAQATLSGPTPAAWDALALGAREEVEALRLEHAVDEVLG